MRHEQQRTAASATTAAPRKQRIANSLEVAQRAATAADDLKALNIVILDVRGSGYADYLVIASGTSDRHVQSIGENIDETLSKLGHRSIGVEGLREGKWGLIDFGDVVAHVFHEFSRDLYDLENLWKKAPRIEFSPVQPNA